MRLHISVDRLDAVELRGATQADFLIAVDGTLRIASDDAILFEEPSFPVVELAWLLSSWRAAPRARFQFDSMSLEEVDTVEIAPSSDGWMVASCHRPGFVLGPFDWAEVDAGIRAFVADVERELRALGLDPAAVMRPPRRGRRERPWSDCGRGVGVAVGIVAQEDDPGMQATTYNARMLRSIIEELASWESGGSGISEIQPLIESTATLLERDESGASELLRSVGAELESIRFTRIDADQHAAAVVCTSRLRADLQALLADHSPDA